MPDCQTNFIREHKLISNANERSKAERDANCPQGLPCIPCKVPDCQTNFIREHKLISNANERSKAERDANRPQGLPCNL